ncbi:phytoene dehydrogenase-like protein [Spirosoma lacussanchae]|uniref:NAD(P)/FAD-dependent oxidoreductase n=1 Tax=Spirosoma lacussanchae TaxID=1884249 RepID=UPI00110917CD|nr:NAD(P)/FAD-dependent oxidoreductase [Spirosoma lacussanchae]
MPAELPVVIVGAGVAGLSCAVYLKQAGIDALVLDAADGVGGRVRTDIVNGFQLDRGFQILLTAYPEARRLLNYNALDLRPFRSGALIRHQEPNQAASWMKLLNPFQEPLSVFATLASPVGTLGDKLRIVELMRRTQSLSVTELFQQTPTTTLALLDDIGFSDQMITRFFRPFFGGVFLEDALVTSSNFFEFCFRMFFEGKAAVPARGIGAIADQLAGRLAPDQIRLKTLVRRISGSTVELASGESLVAGAVVMAVDADQAARLTQQAPPVSRSFNHTTCTYFAAPASPNPEKLLMLNTHRTAAIHNMAVMSDVAPGYAPDGRALISVSTQGLETFIEEALTRRIRQELTDWFGADVASWQHLRTYHLPQALPAYDPTVVHQPLQLAEGLYQCGDQTAYPSLNAALQTGREVAERIVMNHR